MAGMTVAGVSWGIASHPARGQGVPGDRGLVTARPGGVLLVVADGLGHGAEAGRAADLVIRSVEASPAAPLVEIFEQCHARLQETRGAAVSLAAWDETLGALSWLGVGNVEGVVVRSAASPAAVRPRLLLRGGVVGDRMPPLQVETVMLPAAGLLVFATDGIAAGFEQEVDPRRDPQEIADWVLSRCSRQLDDALVLVARLRVRER
jgi:phosphoserine phosphatase RsbX